MMGNESIASCIKAEHEDSRGSSPTYGLFLRRWGVGVYLCERMKTILTAHMPHGALCFLWLLVYGKCMIRVFTRW